MPKSLLINEPIFKLTSLGTFTKVASPLLKPEQAQNPSNSHLFFEDLGDGHPSINQFLTSLITDTCHKGSRFADQTQFLKSEHKDGILTNPLEKQEAAGDQKQSLKLALKAASRA